MKKRGFTLVELLAIIIILAVVALIATPLVLNVMDSAKKSSFESSAYGIIEAVKMNSLDNMLSGDSMEAVYEFPTDEIEFQGTPPDGGQISVDKKGNVAIAIHNDKWCALKDYEDAEVTLVDYDGECTLGMEVTTPGIDDEDAIYYSLVTGTTDDGFVVDVGGTIVSYEGEATEITIPSSVTLPQPTYEKFDKVGCIEYYKENIDTDATDEEAESECERAYLEFPDDLRDVGYLTEENGYLKITDIQYSEPGCIAYVKSIISSYTDEQAKEFCDDTFVPLVNSEMLDSLLEMPATFELFYSQYKMLKGKEEVINHEGELTVQIKTIGGDSLSGKSLTSVTIPNTVKKIGMGAFYNNSLTNVTIPTSVTTIRGQAFNGNQFSEENAFIYARKSDGSIDNTKLVSYAGTSKELTIPSTVKTLDLYSLFGLSLTSVTLPSNLTKIGMYSLASNALTTITLPSSVTEIGESALEKSSTSNKNLTSVVNKTGKAFDWTSITNSSTDDLNFITGTITHSAGDITVTAE